MITTVVEGKRGCGYRKEGGLYLRSDGIGRYCGALPIEVVFGNSAVWSNRRQFPILIHGINRLLSVCPTCHAGIKPARGWTWVNLAALAAVRGCGLSENIERDESWKMNFGCGDCPIADAKIQEVGLLWIGEKYYPNIASFTTEAGNMGLSRRITAIPKRFKLGETWVALAHRKAIPPNHEFRTTATQISEGVDGCYTCQQPEAHEHHQHKPAIFHVFKPQRIEYVIRSDDPKEKLETLEKRGITLVRVVKKEEGVAA